MIAPEVMLILPILALINVLWSVVSKKLQILLVFFLKKFENFTEIFCEIFQKANIMDFVFL